MCLLTFIFTGIVSWWCSVSVKMWWKVCFERGFYFCFFWTENEKVFLIFLSFFLFSRFLFFLWCFFSLLFCWFVWGTLLSFFFAHFNSSASFLSSWFFSPDSADYEEINYWRFCWALCIWVVCEISRFVLLMSFFSSNGNILCFSFLMKGECERRFLDLFWPWFVSVSFQKATFNLDWFRFLHFQIWFLWF